MGQKLSKIGKQRSFFCNYQRLEGMKIIFADDVQMYKSFNRQNQ